MTLKARRPPGHAARKALVYAPEIVRLRQQGHTLDAIREALEDAGVVVSINTVRRELLKAAAATPLRVSATARPISAGTADPPAEAASPGPALCPVTGPTGLPGKAIAEAFMRGRSTNPLFLKETST